MLDVIFCPYVQGRSGGERTFNREVDICKYTWGKKAHAERERRRGSNHMTEEKLSLPTVPPVLREEVERAVGRSLRGGAGDAGALQVPQVNG